MFDRFGEFDSSDEINEIAVNLRKEGDNESIQILAKENGIEIAMADMFINGDLLWLCEPLDAALGKIEIEKKEIAFTEIIDDWCEYIKCCCMNDNEFAIKVRSKKKSLKGAIAVLLKWSFKNMKDVDKDIVKASGISAGRVALGIPSQKTVKKLITEYYMG